MSSIIIRLSFLLVLSKLPISYELDYCRLPCIENGIRYNHTLCQTCAFQRNCESLQHDIRLFRQKVLSVHNQIREEVASGKGAAHLAHITASNMHLLSYDVNLEHMAECFVRRCLDTHDFCRPTKKFRTVGQNFLLYYRKMSPSDTSRSGRPIYYEWYKAEAFRITNRSIDRYPSGPIPYDNLTQLLWAETRAVGCARAFYQKYNRLQDAFRIVCNYGPSGNQVGEAIFKRGAPCSECAVSEACGVDKQFPNLCGKMSVVIETTLGDITVDLFVKQRPRCCTNFLKLCKLKYYNYNLVHTVTRGFMAQTGDPSGSRQGGDSIFGLINGREQRYFEGEIVPRIKHSVKGLISFVGNEEGMLGSQFFFTLADNLTYLDGRHCVFGQVVEGMDVVEAIDSAICDNTDRPYQDIRITHTVVLDDPLPDLKHQPPPPERSPSPSKRRLRGGLLPADQDLAAQNVGKSAAQLQELLEQREAHARATILEMIGDIPDVDVAPPENVLFVCKLNPVTNDDDLEIIFSRFGKVRSCEVIRDRKSGDSLQYAFVEFEERKACEHAYFKMDNVLIDDRRIKVDFSQSVAKVKWLGKGRGVRHYDDVDTEPGPPPTTKSNRTRTDESTRSGSSRRKRSRSRSRGRHRRSSPHHHHHHQRRHGHHKKRHHH